MQNSLRNEMLNLDNYKHIKRKEQGKEEGNISFWANTSRRNS